MMSGSEVCLSRSRPNLSCSTFMSKLVHFGVGKNTNESWSVSVQFRIQTNGMFLTLNVIHFFMRHYSYCLVSTCRDKNTRTRRYQAECNVVVLFNVFMPHRRTNWPLENKCIHAHLSRQLLWQSLAWKAEEGLAGLAGLAGLTGRVRRAGTGHMGAGSGVVAWSGRGRVRSSIVYAIESG